MSVPSDAGPWRIFATPSGDWCDECWTDCKDPTDQDFDRMGINARKLDGECVCCGARVVAGNLLELVLESGTVLSSAIPKEAVHPMTRKEREAAEAAEIEASIARTNIECDAEVGTRTGRMSAALPNLSRPTFDSDLAACSETNS